MKLQTRYSLLQGTYWATSCSMVGFIAIFLVHLGLSNTQIGLASGISCLLACLIASVLSDLTARWSNISLQSFLAFGMLSSALLYVSLVLLVPSRLVVMMIFMLAYCLNTSMVSLLASVSMDYIARGEAVNFGLSRGVGSICYASSAVIFSHLSSVFSPAILAWIFLVGSIVFAWLLFQTPAAYGKANPAADSEQPSSEPSGFGSLIRRSPKFIALLAGFGLLFLAGGMYLMRNGLICLADSIPVLILGLMLQGASFGLMTGVMTYYVREVLSDQDQVLGQTCFIAATNGLGGAAGNLLGGAATGYIRSVGDDRLLPGGFDCRFPDRHENLPACPSSSAPPRSAVVKDRLLLIGLSVNCSTAAFQIGEQRFFRSGFKPLFCLSFR